ncbi:putative quinol monooxygenase [Herbaspirillum lusitanum]|uniref:putative quinol monooxygenase n=1 Tax=Herbaspirillum lusitanum TaxID=213312 RepID=UPI0002D5E2B9|nr:putative quinol monooxygenase [Herbaspirillum lusitanum]MCW5298696.1 antibiotic biosynthesis monooxygenase [Herbaspirillum lusitanum]
MSITRINTFRALDDQVDALKKFLTALLPAIRASSGCQSCQLLQDQTIPARMVIIEVWDSIDAHHQSLQHVPHESIEEVKTMLASPPVGGYYQ